MNINKILAGNPRPCQHGAPMGAASYYRDPAPLHLQIVNMLDGCYAPDGTYWGVGTPLWCAFNDDARIYIRAHTREEAKARTLDFLDHQEDVTFVR